MLLALDVGNTNIGIGVFDGENLRGDWRIRTERERTADEHGALIAELLRHECIEIKQITAVAVSNVVPTMRRTLIEVARRYFDAEPFMIGSDTDFGIGIHYDPPADVGADRLMNAIAAFAKYDGAGIREEFC